MRKILIKSITAPSPQSGIITSKWVRPHSLSDLSCWGLRSFGDTSSLCIKRSQTDTRRQLAGTPRVSSDLEEAPPWDRQRGWSRKCQPPKSSTQNGLTDKRQDRERRGPGLSSPKPTKRGAMFSHFLFRPVSHQLFPNLLIDKRSQQLNSHRKKWATKLIIRLGEDSRDLAPLVLSNLVLASGRLLQWLLMIKNSDTWDGSSGQQRFLGPFQLACYRKKSVSGTDTTQKEEYF